MKSQKPSQVEFKKLSYDEIIEIIDFEDSCGVNNLLQEIFSYGKDNKTVIDKDVEVIASVDDKGNILDYKVVGK